MQIWLDLRFLKSGDRYSTFVAVLIQNLIHLDNENNYTLYLSDQTKVSFPPQLKVEFIKEKPGSIAEQVSFYKKLKKDKNNLMIFFNEKKPLFYRGEYILFVKNLKELHYIEEQNQVKRFIFDLFLKNSLSQAKKIICFEHQTKSELNEKLNILENKIEIIYPFFTLDKISDEKILTDPRIKFNIKWEYFIYSWWRGNNKNLSKLLEVFSKLQKRKCNIHLVVLEQDLIEDLDFRQEVIDNKIVERVHFIWETTLLEKKAFYKYAIWSIFPSLYESFPFDLTESISYKSPILASSIKQTKEIMWDSISYFSPISNIDIIEAIQNYISLPKQNTDYKEILEKYTPKKTVDNLIKVIKS